MLQILIVDDHADTARLMCQLLRKRGYAARSAGSLDLALAEAEKGPLDVLIADIVLSDGSGLDLMRRLSAERSLIGISISGHGAEADIAASAEAGFARHFTKPIDVSDLLTEIQARAAEAGLA